MADNAQTLDALVTKTEGTTTDRKGVNRRVFQQIIMDMGFQPLSGSFQTGATITARNQTLYDEVSHVFYSWGGALPKVVAAGATPATSGGIGAGAWVDRTDLTLRNELSNSILLLAPMGDDSSDYLETMLSYGGEIRLGKTGAYKISRRININVTKDTNYSKMQKFFNHSNLLGFVLSLVFGLFVGTVSAYSNAELKEDPDLALHIAETRVSLTLSDAQKQTLCTNIEKSLPVLESGSESQAL